MLPLHGVELTCNACYMRISAVAQLDVAISYTCARRYVWTECSFCTCKRAPTVMWAQLRFSLDVTLHWYLTSDALLQSRLTAAITKACGRICCALFAALARSLSNAIACTPVCTTSDGVYWAYLNHHFDD